VDLKSPDTAVVWVEENDISQVIGKGGGRISDVENRLGISIDVRSLSEKPAPAAGGNSGGGGAEAPVGAVAPVAVPPPLSPAKSSPRRSLLATSSSRWTVTPATPSKSRPTASTLFTATVSRGGEIQISRGSAIAEEMEQAIDRGKAITVVPS